MAGARDGRGERAVTRTALPEHLGASLTDTSRLLEAVETQHQRRKEREETTLYEKHRALIGEAFELYKLNFLSTVPFHY